MPDLGAGDDISKLKVAELKDELTSRGISLTGLKLKADYAAKLTDVLASQETSTEVEAPAATSETALADVQETTPDEIVVEEETSVDAKLSARSHSEEDVQASTKTPETTVSSSPRPEHTRTRSPLRTRSRSPPTDKHTSTRSPSHSPSRLRSCSPMRVPSVPAVNNAEVNALREKLLASQTSIKSTSKGGSNGANSTSSMIASERDNIAKDKMEEETKLREKLLAEKDAKLLREKLLKDRVQRDTIDTSGNASKRDREQDSGSESMDTDKRRRRGNMDEEEKPMIRIKDDSNENMEADDANMDANRERSLLIENLSRPLTMHEMLSLLNEHGDLIDDDEGEAGLVGCWMDKQRTKCCCTFKHAADAASAKKKIEGIKWPQGNQKHLVVSSISIKAAKEMCLGVGNTSGAGSRRRSSVTDTTGTSERAKAREEALQRKRAAAEKEMRAKNRSLNDDKEKHSKPAISLDTIFRKTTTEPPLYWLPLPGEEVEKRREDAKKSKRSAYRRS
eukprot:CFRG6925T1